MKTIIQVHIFVRLCACGCIAYSLFHLITAWPEVSRLRKVIEKQKETVEMMGGTFNPGGLIPSFAEIFLSPVLMLVIGVLAFLGTKTIVEFIIGKDQIKSLLQADRKESQIQSR